MSADMHRAVEAALRELTPVWEDAGRLMLSVPVRYPSGALAAVEVAGGRDTVWLSDRGFGLMEAEMMGAESSFSAAGKEAASHYGIRFDGHSIFAAEVPVDQIATGIIMVANASAEAATDAIRRETARRADEKNEAIFEKLHRAFPGAAILRTLEIAGERSEWKAHNVVRIGDRMSVFEPVTASPQSISAKFLMFSDLKKRPNVRLNAVVDDLSKLGSKGQMLTDVANILETGAPTERYREVA